jgi:hypothetical protein
MNKNKRNWPITIGIGITLGLALLIMMKNSINPMNDKVRYKIKTDLKALKFALELYNDEFGTYPAQSSDRLLNFAEQLSKQQPSPDLKKSRDMFLDYVQTGMNVDNENYRAPNATATTLLDPFYKPYYYTSDGKTFAVWSTGEDQVNSNQNGDDISHITIEKKKKEK